MAVAIRRALLEERRSLVIRFVRALDASMTKIHDPDVSAILLARNLRLHDRAIIERTPFQLKEKSGAISNYRRMACAMRYAGSNSSRR
jgi:hypothetical protein